MKSLDPRAWSTAAARLRGAMPLSAQDLVQRTLAQHGLAPGSANVPPGMVTPVNRPAAPRNGNPALPDDARFEASTFSCVEGSRRYLTYVPASVAPKASGLIVMLHGCTQTPEDFAAGTRMNELAESQGFIVVYPHQSRGENAQSCWNWFRRGDQARDRGEPAILAGLAQSVASQHGVPSDRIFVAGLSAGAAMAVILGESYPDVFAAVGVHSGLPAGAAKDVPSAFAAMAGTAALSGTGRPGVRSIVLHGTADATVHPGNGRQIVQRLLDHGPRQTLQTEERGQAGGRAFCRSVTTDGTGLVLVEHWEIEGLGHAWSGGSPGGSYTDAQGPDASAEMLRFFLAG